VGVGMGHFLYTSIFLFLITHDLMTKL